MLQQINVHASRRSRNERRTTMFSDKTNDRVKKNWLNQKYLLVQ